jgi:hypothetical protein
MSQQETPGKKRGLTRPVEVVRAELLKDAETKRIANAVGMELEEYVELVLEYAQDKDKEPVLLVGDDADLRAAGHTPKTVDEVVKIIADEVKGAVQFETSEFSSDAPADAGKPSLSGVAGGTQPQGPQDPAARQELLDAVKKGSGGGRA